MVYKPYHVYTGDGYACKHCNKVFFTKNERDSHEQVKQCIPSYRWAGIRQTDIEEWLDATLL